MMRFNLAAVAAASLTLAVAAGGQAAVVAEREANDSFATAQNLDGFFTLGVDPEIFDLGGRPHVTVAGRPGNGTFDYYSVTRPGGGGSIIFDIDHAAPGFDSFLSFYYSDGTPWFSADDNFGDPDPGSVSLSDTFTGGGFGTGSPGGFYYVRVGNSGDGPQSGGSGYRLHVSIDNHPLQVAVPEPATWAMMLMGFGGLGALMRRRRATLAAI